MHTVFEAGLPPAQVPQPSGSALAQVLSLVVPFVGTAERQALRLTSKELQLAHDVLQTKLRIVAHKLLMLEERNATQAVGNLLKRGCPLPHTLTVSHRIHRTGAGHEPGTWDTMDWDTLDWLPGGQLTPLLHEAGKQATSLELRGGIDLTTDAGVVLMTAAMPLLEHLTLRLHPPCLPASPCAMLLSRLSSCLKAFELQDLGSSSEADSVDGLDQLKQCTGLRALRLELCRGDPLPLEWVSGLTGLRRLGLACTVLPANDLSLLSALSRLTSLELGTDIRPQRVGIGPDEQRAYATRSSSLAALLACVAGSLRELRLPQACISAACLAALQSSPLTLLQVRGLDLGLSVAGPVPAHAHAPKLPPALETLHMCQSSVDIATLAALAAAAPPGLQRMVQGPESAYFIHPHAHRSSQGDCERYQIHLDYELNEDVLRTEPGIQEHVLPPVVRAAALLLAGRIMRPTYTQRGSAWQALEALGVRPCQGTGADARRRVLADGPHGAWLRGLAPLGGTLRELRLSNFRFGAGDLPQLAIGLPRMQFLTLQRCAWPPTALLELASLERLRGLNLHKPRLACVASPAAVAALQELCVRAPSLEEVRLCMRASVVVEEAVDAGEAEPAAGAGQGGPADAGNAGGDGNGPRPTPYSYLYVLRKAALALRRRGLGRARVGLFADEFGLHHDELALHTGRRPPGARRPLHYAAASRAVA